MRRIILLFACCFIAVAACNQKATVSPTTLPPGERSLLQLHFRGTTHLLNGPDAATWKTMFELPASQNVGAQILDKLAITPFVLARELGATNDFADIFNDLFADLIVNESFFEITGKSSNSVSGFILAVRLPPARAAYWKSNLKVVLEEWTGRALQQPESGDFIWSFGKVDQLAVFLTSVGDWILIGAGDVKERKAHCAAQIRETGTPAPTTDAWLELSFDSQFICKNLLTTNQLEMVNWPKVDIEVRPRAQGLNLAGKLVFPEPLTTEFERWQIPTNLIREPIIGFTAMREIGPILEPVRRNLGFDVPIPDQFYVWTGYNFPVQMMGAAPMRDAKEWVRRLSSPMQDKFNRQLQAADAGYLSFQTNVAGDEAIRWLGIPPWVTPFISSTETEAKREGFVTVGTYPNSLGTNPPPILFHHLHQRTNLVYYDWEITGARFQSWRAIVNVFRHFFDKPRIQPTSPSVVWVNAVSNRLGNTITEIAITDVNELSLIREGPVLFTGIELLAIAHWLESL